VTSQSRFISGRTGRGAAYSSDASGAAHDKFMRFTAVLLAPLGLLAGWFLARLTGMPYEAARAELAHPLPALSLIAFAVVSMPHARMGAESIIIDYVHDPKLKELALTANKWLAIAVAVLWTLTIMVVAAPR
jgi:succinate dehydrogenase hydrophobic membrane anchor protein